MLAGATAARIGGRTYCWEEAQGEDTEQTGLAASAIADDDELPAGGMVVSMPNCNGRAREAARTTPGGECSPADHVLRIVGRHGSGLGVRGSGWIGGGGRYGRRAEVVVLSAPSSRRTEVSVLVVETRR